MHGATLGDRCHTAGATPADRTAAACPFRVRGKVHGRPRDSEVQHQSAHPAGSRPLGWRSQPLPAGENGRPPGQERSRVTCCCSWTSELWDTGLSEEDILWLSDFWLKADMLPGPPGPLRVFPAALRSGGDLGRYCGLWQVVCLGDSAGGLLLVSVGLAWCLPSASAPPSPCDYLARTAGPFLTCESEADEQGVPDARKPCDQVGPFPSLGARIARARDQHLQCPPSAPEG